MAPSPPPSASVAACASAPSAADNRIHNETHRELALIVPRRRRSLRLLCLPFRRLGRSGGVQPFCLAQKVDVASTWTNARQPPQGCLFLARFGGAVPIAAPSLSPRRRPPWREQQLVLLPRRAGEASDAPRVMVTATASTVFTPVSSTTNSAPSTSSLDDEEPLCLPRSQSLKDRRGEGSAVLPRAEGRCCVDLDERPTTSARMLVLGSLRGGTSRRRSLSEPTTPTAVEGTSTGRPSPVSR